MIMVRVRSRVPVSGRGVTSYGALSPERLQPV